MPEWIAQDFPNLAAGLARVEAEKRAALAGAGMVTAPHPTRDTGHWEGLRAIHHALAASQVFGPIGKVRGDA